MFRETLLESSSQSKKRRWPMATAFILRVIAVALLILVPMLTTGVIPLSAHTVVIEPTYQPHAVLRPMAGTSTPRLAGSASVTQYVQISSDPRISYGKPQQTGSQEQEAVPDLTIGRGTGSGCCLEGGGDPPTVVLEPPEQQQQKQKRVRISELSEAQLIDGVKPAYPMIAQRAGIQGDVKLHALIARDGSIQSLSLISGPPLLVQAAVNAVRQWKYRPYILNGEAVEVETLITVSFKRKM